MQDRTWAARTETSPVTGHASAAVTDVIRNCGVRFTLTGSTSFPGRGDRMRNAPSGHITSRSS
ncbi:MAG: hypothetical protein IJ658_08505 [Kiritimatiellae bacterium]|nr:hypothetical protein [Kiritimatiellia bacterium]